MKNVLRVLFLLPVSWIYSLVVKIRNLLYDTKVFKSVSFEVPIISVGNITVGGTGKTPHIELIIRLLKEERNIAVLSRGYKRKSKGFVLAQTNSTADEIGDELRQIKQKFPDVTVAADEDRVRGVRKLLKKQPSLNLILLDDAFQHRHIQPGMSILLIDYNRPLEEDYFLPFGRLRESIKQVRRGHVVIVSKTPETIKPIEMRVISQNLNILPYQTLFFTGLKYHKPEPVFSDTSYPIDEKLMKKQNWHILVVAGIAAPGALMSYAENLGGKAELIKFPDHHRFKPKDIRKIDEHFQQIETDKKIILTTEKDAMRFHAVEIKNNKLRERMLYVPIEPTLLNEDKNSFAQYLKTYIKNAENDYKFHSTYKQTFGD